MARYTDLTGQKFGKLLVLNISSKTGKNAEIYWECKCDCGNITSTRASNLPCGKTTSCGCNTNQSHILKFKKENPDATDQEILQERLKTHTKWNGDCLEWTATLSSNGYGVFVLNKKTINASRAAWIAENGEIEGKLCVLHTCDNRKCCNVNHMFLSTHKVNTEDMVSKGRDNWQTCRKFPIGTREKVGEMRESGKMYREIASELGLTMDQVKSLLQLYKKNSQKKV